MRAFCSGDKACEALTSKMASTREAVTLACCPPGPDERETRSSISSSGKVTPSLMGKLGMTDLQAHNFEPRQRLESAVQPPTFGS